MRAAVERWGRTLWPDARQVHELVMNRGSVRADMAIIGQNHFVSVEIKSEYDSTERLMNQSGMFRLASPELWLVMHQRHLHDADLIRYLIPSIGVARAVREKVYSGPFEIEVVHQAQRYVPLPEAMLSLLWVAELHDEAVRRRLWSGKAPTHAKLVKLLERNLSGQEQIEAVCRQLRARDALWRADPVVEIAA